MSLSSMASSTRSLTTTAGGPRNAKIIVFDLDYTLWPFWVDTHVTLPIRKDKNGDVFDAIGWKVKHYPDVPRILHELTEAGYKIGIASRTSEIVGAETLLNLFDWNKYITYKQIFPGCKVTHFINIKKDSGVEYTDMIFFDDEARNIKDVQRLGVNSILIRSGVSKAIVDEVLAGHAAKST